MLVYATVDIIILFSTVILGHAQISSYHQFHHFVQFRLSEMERTVFGQLWDNVIHKTPFLAADDFSVDDRDDKGPPG